MPRHPNYESIPAVAADMPPGGSYDRGTLTLLAHTFGINHAAVTTPILYQSTYMGQHLGNWNNIVLYAVTMVTSLFGAAIMRILWGTRAGLFMSMLGYALYAALFAFALTCPHAHEVMDGTGEPGRGMYMLGILGSCVGGLAAGPLWTFHGVLAGQIAEDVSKKESHERASVATELLGIFGWWFLVWEAAFRALTTVLLQSGVAPPTVFLLYSFVAVIAALVFFFCTPPARPDTGGLMVLEKVTEAIALWRDPRIWLLQFTGVTFGFAAAWNASYVSPVFVSKALSPELIGFAGALTSVIGGISSRALSNSGASKPAIILFGSVCFLSLALLSKLLRDGEALGLRVLVFPLLMGLGRAVFESTNRAVFLDFYPDPRMHTGAFANLMFFTTFSSAVVFALDSRGAFHVVMLLLTLCSVLTYPALRQAEQLQVSLVKDDSSTECAKPS